ncbi:hypothetical protein [Robinsoniella peoriensis]
MNRTKREKNISYPLSFYDQSSTEQGMNGKHEAYPMDFYTMNNRKS